MFPSRTGVNITPATYRELAKHPNIVAAKEASGNISQIAQIAQACGDELDLYSGNDDQIVPLLSLGGKGRYLGSFQHYATRNSRHLPSVL